MANVKQVQFSVGLAQKMRKTDSPLLPRRQRRDDLSRGMNHSDPLQYQCCSGFYIDIFNSLKDRLKFEFELYQVLDRTWGARNPLTVRASPKSRGE